jgi:CRP-like cAMP-binding protein
MLDREGARAVLARKGWLSRTAPGFREQVLDRATLHHVERGEVLHRVGDPPGGLWGLAEGALAADIAPAERGPTFAHFGLPGFWSGEGSLIARAPRRVGLVATRRSTLLHLSQPAFDAIVAQEPGAWRWMALLSHEHVTAAIGFVDDLTIRDSQRRTIALMLRLARRRLAEEDAPSDGPVDVDVSQETLCELCNLSRSVLGRILRDLAGRRLIELAYRRIRITDAAALRAALAS